MIKTLHILKEEFPDLFIIVDVCLCPYTNHGHCGVLTEEGTIDNQKSIIRLGAISLAYARAGADCIAPSDCMDERIGFIKNLL